VTHTAHRGARKSAGLLKAESEHPMSIDFNAEMAQLQAGISASKGAAEQLAALQKQRQLALLQAQGTFDAAQSLLVQAARVVGDVPGVFVASQFRETLSRVATWMRTARFNRMAAQSNNTATQALLNAAVGASLAAALADVQALSSQIDSLKRALLRAAAPAVPAGCDDDVADRKGDIAASVLASKASAPFLLDQFYKEQDQLSLAVLLGPPMRLPLQRANIDQQSLQRTFVERVFADAEDAAIAVLDSGSNLDRAAQVDLARRGRGVSFQALSWFMPAFQGKRVGLGELSAGEADAMARAEAIYLVVYLGEADQAPASAEVIIRQS
jgi:hypothetical protein